MNTSSPRIGYAQISTLGQAESVAAAKRRGVYCGRPPRIDMEVMQEHIINRLSPTGIARERDDSRKTVYETKAPI